MSKDNTNEQFNRAVLRGLCLSLRKSARYAHMADILIRQWDETLVKGMSSYQLPDGGYSFRIRKGVFNADKRKANSAMQSLQIVFNKIGRRAVFKKGRYSGELHVSGRKPTDNA